MEEITIATDFLAQYLLPHISEMQLESFKSSLSKLMNKKFLNSWDFNIPIKGNAFRAINIIESRLDSLLVQAALDSNFELKSEFFPQSFVLWIDPHSVSFRVGDYGNAEYIYDSSSENYSNSSSSSSPLRSPLRDDFNSSLFVH